VELFSSLAPWPVVAPNHSDTPESHMAQTELQRAIRQAVDSLVDKQRIAFTLSKYEELPQAQIAEIMMISEGAVESLLQRAKINLQKKLTSLKNFNE
jgi:RNA polymerase sigma-70 factor (ECF subfamily)